MSDEPDNDLCARFNSLSWQDRQKLRGAALIKDVTGIIREDIKRHPWMYPFHAAYLICLVTPLPFVGFTWGIQIPLTVLAAAAIVAKGPKDWWVRQRLTEAFNDEALAKLSGPFIRQDPRHPGRPAVDTVALAKDMAKATLTDTGASLAYPWVMLKQAFRKPPKPGNP